MKILIFQLHFKCSGDCDGGGDGGGGSGDGGNGGDGGCVVTVVLFV